MGNHSSKKSKKSKKFRKTDFRRSQSVLDFMMDTENSVRVISQSSYDQAQVFKLQKELREAPQIFVLNNLLMSVMFFENYEKEKHQILHSTGSTMEKELNPTLLRDETIECVIPDDIFESVNKNVKYRPVHGPNKTKAEPLIPRRLFVVNDNIEVLESIDIPQYSAIDKPGYQVRIEESERNGFVKLKCVDSQARPINQQGNDGFNEPRPGPSSRYESNDIYEYSTITDVNTPKPLNIINCERRDTLPKTCFTTRKIRKLEELDSSDEDDDVFEEAPQRNEPILYETVSYISSTGFMTHFQNAVFPNSLGKALGFDMTEIGSAKAIPGKIFCNLLDDELNGIPCEVVPSVAIQWPAKLTFDFPQRGERPIMVDKFGKKYLWPEEDMVKEIASLKCVLVPRGFIQKRGENSDSEIEWEVGFPKAERYLDIRMSHAQMRTFLFLLTIFKAYIEPTTKQHGLLVDHIRNHMYWECESNPRDWPEHKLGTKIIAVIKNLNNKLSVSHLSDYFIKQRNLFENIPNKYLKHAQKVFHDVLGSPAVYFIGALRNLRYTSGKFYPTLDFKKLYTILTTQEAIKMVNSNILEAIPPNLYPKKRYVDSTKGDMNYRRDLDWRYRQERVNREKILRKRREENERKENLEDVRKGSIDSIDLEWECDQRFDLMKSREILMIFIKHFIEIARRSRKLATQRQALLYLKQAYYLAKLLEESGLQADARDLLEIISKEEETSKKLSVSESFDYELPPSTPQRNSLQFNWEITQQVKSNNINLNNLNKSYNNAAVATSPMNFNKIKKMPSNLKGRASVMNDRRKSLDATGRKSVGFSETLDIR